MSLILRDIFVCLTDFWYPISGTGCVQPFMQVYARQLGFSSFVVGTIYTILPILGLISKPLFGALADRYVVFIYLSVYTTLYCVILGRMMSYQCQSA